MTTPVRSEGQIEAVVFDAVVTTPGTDLADSVTVRLVDEAGESVSVSLADRLPLKGSVPGQYLVAPWLQSTALNEPVPQTYRIPLEDVGGDTAFDAAELATVTLEFDGATGGTVLLDDIGVAGEPTSTSRP